MNEQIALITGGGRGLGKNAALALAGRGIDIILTYNSNQQEADATVSAISATDRKAKDYSTERFGNSRLS